MEKKYSEWDLESAIQRLVTSILDQNAHGDDLVLLSVLPTAMPLVTRIRDRIFQIKDRLVLVGNLDIALYRPRDTIKEDFVSIYGSKIPCDLNQKRIILVVDVLDTWDIQAAIEALLDYGKPAKVELLSLVQIQFQALPIQSNYLGFPIEGIIDAKVFWLEIDGEDRIDITHQVG